MAKVLYLVRHTSVAIGKGICYGQTDVDVAEDFERVSGLIKEKLSGLNFDRIYSSPLKRCYRLAKVLAQKATDKALPSLLDKPSTDVSVQKFTDEPGFRNEGGSGLHNPMQDCDADEALSSLLDKPFINVLSQKVIIDERLMEMSFGDWEMKSWDEIYDLPEGRRWFADYIHAVCPNGESFTQLSGRVSGFMKMLDGTAQQNVLIIAHAGTIRAMLVCLGITSADEAFNISVEYGEVLKIEKNRYQLM